MTPRKKPDSESRVRRRNTLDLPADEPLARGEEIELGLPFDLAHEIASLNESLGSSSKQNNSTQNEESSSEKAAPNQNSPSKAIPNQNEPQSSSDSDDEMIADDAIDLIVTSTNVDESGKASQSAVTSPEKSRDATSPDFDQSRKVSSPVLSLHIDEKSPDHSSVKRHRIYLIPRDDNGDIFENSFEGTDKNESKKGDDAKSDLSSSDVSMEDVSVSKQNEKTARRGSKLAVPANISLSLLDTETVGMLAPSTEGPSAEDLEAEKAKWSVLMSTSASNR